MASSLASSSRSKRPRRTIRNEDLEFMSEFEHESEHESESEPDSAPVRTAPAPAPPAQANVPAPRRRRSTHVSFFPNRAALHEFEASVGSREVMIERKFCEKFLRERNWPYLDDLKAWGWWDFMKWNNKVFVDMVRVFYFNGDNRQYDRNGIPVPGAAFADGFVTSVLGNRIVVDPDLIAKFLPNPMCNECDESYDLDAVQATQVVYNNPNLDKFYDTVTSLGFNNRMLHLLLCCTINPRVGTHSKVNRLEMGIMARIILKKPPNLCKIVAERMTDAVESFQSDNPQGEIPYGRLTSKICKFFCPNKGKEREGGKELTIVNQKAVKIMGFREREGVYVWVGTKQNRRPAVGAPQPPAQAPEPAPQGMGAMDLSALATQIQQLREENRQAQEANLLWQQQTAQWMDQQNQWRDVRNQRDIYFDAHLQELRAAQNLPPSSHLFPVYPPPPPPPPEQ